MAIQGLRPWAAAILAVFLLSACAAQYRNHGYAPSDDELANIIVGVDSRASVEDSVGAPTAGGVLDESGFYYVRSQVLHRGGMAPKVVDRQVVAISFDSRGIVSNVERFTLEDGKVVPISRRVTNSNISKSSFLRQLLGSIGNLSADQL